MLSKNEFAVLYTLAQSDNCLTQRDIAEASGLSLGSVNSTIASLKDRSLIEDYRVNDAGWAALEPHKVTNAIIMAAGLSSRFVPISYEIPKGLLKVRGEILIERQILQLQEAGITDITVVVGYKKEGFFYLEDKFGVNIIVNPLYSPRNNNYTLWLVREKLANTYICSSDNYFTENVFEPYVYGAYYSATYSEKLTNEYVLTVGSYDTITKVSTTGGENSWFMLGHAYFDRTFSQRFIEILNEIVEHPETYGKLWEDIYSEHVKELPMQMRRYPKGVVYELDTLDELRIFDPAFLDNVDSCILDNISRVLNCSRNDVMNIEPIKQGLTNMSFKFTVNGAPYVYRHPGPGTDEIIERKAETKAEEVASELGLDKTFIFEDEKEGWKISRFIENCVSLDYHNDDHVQKAIGLARKLHDCGTKIEAQFDVYKKGCDLVDMLEERYRASFADFEEITAIIEQIHSNLKEDGVESCLCHNDFYDTNFLFAPDGEAYLIDWEYAGMGDYASDLGTFICCSDYSYDEALDVINLYFGRTPTPAELKHCIGYVALSAYYWFVWAIYKDSCGDNVGEYMYIWYRFAKEYARRALEL